MKSTSSLALVLLTIFSFIQATRAVITPISTSFFGNGGMRSFVIAEFVSTDTTAPNSNIIGIHVKFPGDFPTYKNHYGEFKCGGVFNKSDMNNLGVVPILNYPFTKTSSGGFTYVTTSINLYHAQGVNGLVPFQSQLLKDFKIYCTYASPMPTYGVSPVTFTATIDGATYSISGTGENKPRVVPNKNLSLFISHTYSITQPTTLTIRGVQAFTTNTIMTLRNPPASRSYNITPFDFYEYLAGGTSCEIYRNGVYSGSIPSKIGERGGTYYTAQAVSFLQTVSWNSFQDYDIYCDKLRALPSWDDFGSLVAKYTPGMLEFSYENTHFYYNTAYTQNIPVPTYVTSTPTSASTSASNSAATSATSATSASFSPAEDAEIENEEEEIYPYHISNYANYDEKYDVPVEHESDDVTSTEMHLNGRLGD